MKIYKCMDCLTSFEAEYKGNCPSCDDDIDVIEVSAHTDKLSVEELQAIRIKELKDFSMKILKAELKNQKLQEQLNTTKKALTEIVFFSQGCYPPKYFASIAQKALAAIGNEGSGDER